MRSKPLIRWAGSKRKLLPLLKEKSPLSYNRYVEPFCGSASLFFELTSSNALLSDINSDLINALREIKENPSLRDQLLKIPATKEEYYRIRDVNPDSLTSSKRAIRFLYLNRYCFNGVYRTNKNGKFNVPFGTKTGGFPKQETFDYARERLSNTELIVADYKTTLNKLEDGDFVYIDPPYSKSGRFTGEYGVGSFDSAELPEFYTFLDKMNSKGIKFLFSYRACKETVEVLSDSYQISTISVNRHISGFKSNWNTTDEILVRNYID
ncbi:Dam family site-specific DNA-(adenine-N6)-methyltransferase [Halomonas sp. NyZ770]|uniref:DNA adenine methylase n=1 Tax=Halomonas sp. NyZ770 TaxID=2883106 RepID=UPI001D0AAF6C|nr:Dam family site-specific DNA-(adenine-N6)-methyltransferase [Halomonas sp. NyZ770]UDM07085.1 Dam family site-specific DNA-(adenine-N6)-methyltransferase [Halomonas sp. NyZ770]